jgi:pilus assembly protein Flp/PilA
LRQFTKIVWDFVRRDEAMTATEYAVMLALVVCLCMGPVQTLGCRANRSFTNTSNSIGS